MGKMRASNMHLPFFCLTSDLTIGGAASTLDSSAANVDLSEKKPYDLMFLGWHRLPGVAFVLSIPAVLWLWALIDVLRNDFKDSVTKVIWLIAIIFVPFLGALLYLLIGRRQRIA